MKTEEQTKQMLIGRLETLMEGKTQKEKEETLSGEKYTLKRHLALTKEQTLKIQIKIETLEKFTIIDNKLTFEGIALSLGDVEAT